MSTIEQRIRDLGLDFPEVTMTGQGCAPYKIVDDLLFVGGVAPVDSNGRLAYCGRIGTQYTTAQGYEAGRLTALHMLRLVKDELGTLDRVDYLLKSMVLVSAVPGFQEINKVADGFSDLLTEALGERGKHARNAVGASALNANAPIICDVIIKLRD